MNSKTLATLAALALTTSVANTGCMAQPNDADEDGQDEVANVTQNQTAEKTGEADQACGGFGWGGFGWGGCGGFGWGGFGWGGCGGFGWGGCGGFGWGGFGWGGFGGCGGCFGGCW